MPEPLHSTLIGDGIPATTARVRFVTPTELKFQRLPAARPEFAVLFARIRDRVSALSSFYGPAPLDIDFRAMGERASRVEMTRCDLHDEHASRRFEPHRPGAPVRGLYRRSRVPRGFGGISSRSCERPAGPAWAGKPSGERARFQLL